MGQSYLKRLTIKYPLVRNDEKLLFVSLTFKLGARDANFISVYRMFSRGVEREVASEEVRTRFVFGI